MCDEGTSINHSVAKITINSFTVLRISKFELLAHQSLIASIKLDRTSLQPSRHKIELQFST